MATRQWCVARGGHLPAACRRQSRSPGCAPRPRGSHAFRCVSGYGVRRVARDGSLSATLLRRAACAGVAEREGRWSKQLKAARGRQWTKRGADLLREDHAWSERHGTEQQTSATCFAAPSFLFAEAVLTVSHVGQSARLPTSRSALCLRRRMAVDIPLVTR